jgi:hypothetical protein
MAVHREQVPVQCVLPCRSLAYPGRIHPVYELLYVWIDTTVCRVSYHPTRTARSVSHGYSASVQEVHRISSMLLMASRMSAVSVPSQSGRSPM